MEGVSVESVLKRGFAWVKDSQGKTIYGKHSAEQEQELTIRFADGEIKSYLRETTQTSDAEIKNNIKPKTKKSKNSQDENKQESLFDF